MWFQRDLYSVIILVDVNYIIPCGKKYLDTVSDQNIWHGQYKKATQRLWTIIIIEAVLYDTGLSTALDS